MHDNFKGALFWPDPSLLIFPIPNNPNYLLAEDGAALLDENGQPLEIE